MVARGALVNFALLFGTTAVMLAAAEVFIRLEFPVMKTIYELDDRLLFRLTPNSRKIFFGRRENGGQRITVSINRHGFRGADFDVQTTLPRVVVYGDSFIEGEYSSEEETFVAQLDKAVEAVIPGAEIVNAGVTAYGPDQIALKLEREISVLKPKLIIVSLFLGNDFGELTRNKLFHLVEGNLVENRPEMSAELKRDFENAQRISNEPGLKSLARLFLRAVEEQSSEKSGFMNDYFETSLALRNQECASYFGEPQNVTNLFYDTFDADMALQSHGPCQVAKLALLESILDRINTTVAAHRTLWTLMIIPDPIAVARDYDLGVDTKVYTDFNPRRLTDLVEAIAKRRGYSYVNLFETLTEDTEPLFFRSGDNHWNAKGQAKAAQHMAPLVATVLRAVPPR